MVLALLGSGEGVDGAEVARRLEDAGRRGSSAQIFGHLLALEDSGHVRVARGEQYLFSLTPAGESAAYDLGPGSPGDLVLVMGDLVGYVAYTAAHGDRAAHTAAQRLLDAAAFELDRAGGRLVKSLGDGFLGALPPSTDGIAVVRAVWARFGDAAGLAMRAAVHRGTPIQHRGDVFGADVNLVARLCDEARAGQLVVSMSAAPRPHEAREQIGVRGLDEPVAVTREPIA